MPALAGDFVKMFVDGYELTGDTNRIVINDMRNFHDVTTYGDTVHRFIPGLRASSIAHGGYLNPSITPSLASHPVLKGSDISGVVTVLMGQNATPVVGDPTYSMLVNQGRYDSGLEFNKTVPFGALFANRGDRGGWGVAHAVPTVFTNTFNGVAVDNGVQTTGGGAAFLHVIDPSGADTYTLTLQSSSDNVNWDNLVIFNLNATVIGSERKAISGAIPRYTRWRVVNYGTEFNQVKAVATLVRF